MKIRKEFKVGVVVLGAVGIMYAGINYLKGVNFLVNQDEYYAVYDEIGGLSVANPVLLNGYKVGQVYEMQLMPDASGRVLVSYILSEKELKIPMDSEFRIFSSDLLGSKAVQLNFGDSSVYAVPGDTLSADIEESLSEAVNRQIQPLKNKAEELIANFDSVMTTVQSIFNEEAKEDLSESFTSIREALSSFKNTALRLDTLMIQERIKISAILANMQSITQNLAENNDNLTNILNNFEAISDSLAHADIKATVDNAKFALENASQIMEKINNGEGSMGMLINNDTLYNNLTNSSQELEWLLEDMRIHPNRYLQFSVFGKRNKTVKLSKKDIEEIKKSIEGTE